MVFEYYSSGEARVLATKAGCVKLLLAALKAHSSDAGVVTETCRALSNIVINGEIEMARFDWCICNDAPH